MKEEKYYCDLCKEEREKESLLTMFHNGNNYVLVCWINPQWPQHDHKHICQNCVKLIKEYK